MVSFNLFLIVLDAILKSELALRIKVLTANPNCFCGFNIVSLDAEVKGIKLSPTNPASAKYADTLAASLIVLLLSP